MLNGSEIAEIRFFIFSYHFEKVWVIFNAFEEFLNVNVVT